MNKKAELFQETGNMEVKISEVFKVFKTRKKLLSCEITVKTLQVIWKQWFYMLNWFLFYLKKKYIMSIKIFVLA